VQVAYWRDSDTLFQHALAVAADNATTRELYGQSLIEEGRTDEGLSQLRKAVELAPNDHFAHARLATGLAAARRVDEAIREFERAIALRDDQPSAYCQLAALYASQGRKDEAKKCFDKAVRLMPELEALARQPGANP
jgi:Flp pilus assembly protein TadD